jgi:hypothetical protein
VIRNNQYRYGNSQTGKETFRQTERRILVQRGSLTDKTTDEQLGDTRTPFLAQSSLMEMATKCVRLVGPHMHAKNSNAEKK